MKRRVLGSVSGVLLLVTLVICGFSTSTYALTNTVTQIVEINVSTNSSNPEFSCSPTVGPIDPGGPGPEVPDTGFGVMIESDGGLSVLVAVVAVVAVVGATVLLLLFKNHRLSFRKSRLTVAAVSAIGLGAVLTLAFAVFTVRAEPVNPLIDVDPTENCLDILAGAESSFDMKTIISTDPDTVSYSASVMSDNVYPLIELILMDGSTPITVPNNGDSAVSIGSITGPASSVESPYTLVVVINSALPAGNYIIIVTYIIDTVEPTLPPEPPPVPDSGTCLGNDMGYIGSMQAFTQAEADSWEIYDSALATDSRNGQDYYICKMPDEKVWMINNLKIGLGDVAGNPTLSKPGINTAALAAAATPNNSSTGTPQYNVPIFSQPPTGTAGLLDTTFYGYLYNWCAVTGATTTTCTNSTTVPSNATTDICPLGWRLPTGGSTGEFAWLNAKFVDWAATAPSTLGTAAYRLNWQPTGVFRGVYSGTWFGSFSMQGSAGFLWTSIRGTQNSGRNTAFNFTIIGSTVTAMFDESNRYNGFAARCIFE